MNGTGQTLLTLAALALLSVLTLNANRLILGSFQNQLATKQTVAAMIQGNSLLEEIQSKAFDQAVASKSGVGKRSKSAGITVADLKAPPLGPESGERYPFNDLDDYNGYTCKAWNPLFFDSLSLSTTVFYVTASDPSTQSSVRTSLKKVIVKVTAKGMVTAAGKQDTLAFQQVVYQ
jgi:hypothetical protein